jgi:hypothetical protein
LNHFFLKILCDDSDFTCSRVFSHLPARQKEKAMGSITEVVQTVKDPKSIIRGMNDETDATKHEELDKLNYEFALPKLVESENTSTPPSNHMSRFSSYEERNNKSSRKSGITSFKGYLFIYLFFKCDPCIIIHL